MSLAKLKKLETLAESLPSTELSETLKEWLRVSKTHGLDRLVISKCTILKVIWSIALLISTTFCSILIAHIVIDYYHYEVKTRIREVFVERVPFPTVSVCNLNPFTTPAANDYIRNYFQTEYNLTIKEFADFFKQNKTNQFDNELQYILYRLNDPDLSDDLRKSMGQTKLLECSINNMDCSNDYIWYFDSSFGNCLLLNPNKFENGSERLPYEAYIQGLGLTFTIYLGPYEAESSYLYDPDGKKGILIRVHDFESDGVLLDGIGITPGTQAQIVLDRIETHNMPKPYSNCLLKESIDTKYSRLLEKMQIDYSRMTCIALCHQDQSVDQVGCNHMGKLLIPGKPFCKTKQEFYNLSLAKFNFASCSEQCPIECDTVSYETSVSYLVFPTFNNFYAKYASNRDIFDSANITYDEARKTFSGANIFFDEIKYVEIVESESMKFVDLLAAIGGMMGLFLGFSLMIFVELIELVIQFFLALYNTKFSSPEVIVKF